MLIKAVAMLLLLILLPANAQSSSERQCRLKTLEGIDAQEMMVKGIIMHTEFQEDPKDTAGQNEITFIHTLRADWTIWICIICTSYTTTKSITIRICEAIFASINTITTFTNIAG